MAIDTRFLKTAKDKTVAAARAGMQFAQENPALSLGSAAAMLIAPAIFKNDQRGYKQTAAITTPLIAAVSYSAPSIIGSFRSQFSKHKVPIAEDVRAAWKNTGAARAAGNADVRQATQDYSSSSGPMNVQDDVMRKYYAGRMRKSPNLTNESEVLMGHLKGKSGVFGEGKQVAGTTLTYLSKALHAEKLHSLSASDLVYYSKQLDPSGWESLSNMRAPLLSEEEIMSGIQPFLNNPSFVRGMISRVARMDRYVMQPEFIKSSNSMVARYSSVSWRTAPALQRSLQAQRPDLYGAIQAGIKEGKISEKNINILSMEGKGKQIVGLQYRGTRGITIPVIDSKGAVRTGKGFRRVGIGGNVYTAGAEMPSDVYAIEALRRNYDLKSIKTELGRANLYGRVEAADDFSAYALPEYEQYVQSDSAFALRKHRVIPSELFGFVHTDSRGNETTGGIGVLNAEERLRIHASAKDRGWTTVGSDSGPSKMIYQHAELNQLAFVPSVAKQDATYRSFTKNTRLTNIPDRIPGNLTRVRDSLAPFSTTDYMATTNPDVKLNQISMRVGGITAGEKTLFGDLPEKIEDLSEYRKQAVRTLMRERNLDLPTATRRWKQIDKWLRDDPERLTSMRQIGYLGEGGALARKNLYGMGVETKTRLYMDEMYFKDWKRYEGTSIEEAFGANHGAKPLLGYDKSGNPIEARGYRNYIENVHEMDGELGVDIRSVEKFGTGTKFDGLVKGLIHGVQDDEMEHIKSGLNFYHDLNKTGGFIGNEVEQLQVLHYSQNKTDVRKAILNIAGDTFRRLDETEEIGHVATHLKDLEGLGFSYSKGTLHTPGNVNQTVHDHAMNIIEDMFKEVSYKLRTNQMKGDALMQHFTASSGTKYEQYVHRYASPTDLRVWDSSKINVAEQAKVTYDMLQQLSIKGYTGALNDIMSRVTPDGDPILTENLKDYMSGNKGSITREVSVTDAIGANTELEGMHTPEGRSGTMFDPGSELASDNFLLKLSGGQTVPVLGHDAFGGKTNRFAGGEFSTSDIENHLMNLIRHQNDPDVDTYIDAYYDSLKQHIYGKKGFLRMDRIDREAGIVGFIQTRASTLKKGMVVNPYEIGIDINLLDRIKDKSIKNALLAYEKDNSAPEVFAMLARHPVSDTPFVRVRIDRNLSNTNLIGIDEGMRGLLMADQDKDPVYAFFMRHNMKGYKEAHAAVHGEDSSQRAAIRFQQDLEGIKDDPRQYFTRSAKEMEEARGNMKDIAMKGLFEQIQTPGGDWKELDSLGKALRARSTSASIGAFSNTLTQTLIGIEHNSNITNVEEKRNLARYFFTSIRQGPLSATKNITDSTMNEARALGINSKLKKSLEEGGKFDDFRSSMLELADATDNGSFENPGAFRTYFSKNTELFERYFHGFNKAEAAQAKDVLSASPSQVLKAKNLSMGEEVMPYLRESIKAEGYVARASRAGESASNASAAWLGVVNKVKTGASEAARDVRKSKIGLVLGIGVALAAVGGIASTSFSMRSSNNFRPEDVSGTPNSSPGSAHEGTRSARPARTLVGSKTQTRTAMVAALGQTADLDVRMKAKDRSRAHETTKMLRRMATDGDSNVTINYKESNRKSLRSKERMKDMLDDE
jgi:hypothetical protein